MASERRRVSAVLARRAVLPTGECEHVGIFVDSNGDISGVEEFRGQEEAEAAVRARAGPHGRVLLAPWAVPGFVDIHTHGRGSAATREVLDEWLDDPAEGLRYAADCGTTSVLASVTFPRDDPNDNFEKTVESLRGWVGKTDHGGAVIEGAHVEGPVIRDRGGLVESDATMPPLSFASFLDKMHGVARVMTISPSQDRQGEERDSYPRLRALRERGIIAALGHDKQCSEEDILGALRLQTADWRMHLTHLFNVQTFHHREFGLANIGLVSSFPDLERYWGLVTPTVEVIGDLVHVNPLTLQLVFSSRSSEDVCLISDSILGDSPESHSRKFTYGGRPIRVKHPDDGGPPHVVVGTDNADVIAGSCTNMLEMFRLVKRKFRQGTVAAVNMCASTPARVAGKALWLRFCP
jgi:N-acetylglucosamine-6-phosphate deacetylase